jgi:iron transport multicopper oxidase
MTVIEADGIEHQPTVVDSLNIFVGQRYSVIVEANAPIGNYWFRAVPGPAVVNSTLNSNLFFILGSTWTCLTLRFIS